MRRAGGAEKGRGSSGRETCAPAAAGARAAGGPYMEALLWGLKQPASTGPGTTSAAGRARDRDSGAAASGGDLPSPLAPTPPPGGPPRSGAAGGGQISGTPAAVHMDAQVALEAYAPASAALRPLSSPSATGAHAGGPKAADDVSAELSVPVGTFCVRKACVHALAPVPGRLHLCRCSQSSIVFPAPNSVCCGPRMHACAQELRRALLQEIKIVSQKDAEIQVLREQAAERDLRLAAFANGDLLPHGLPGHAAAGTSNPGDLSEALLSEMRAQVQLSEHLSEQLEQAEIQIDDLHKKLEHLTEENKALKLALDEVKQRRELDGMQDEMAKKDAENMALKLALGEAKQRAADAQEIARQKARLEITLAMMDERQMSSEQALEKTENTLREKEQELQALRVEMAREKARLETTLAKIDEEQKERAGKHEATTTAMADMKQALAKMENALQDKNQQLSDAWEEAGRERREWAEESAKTKEREKEILALIAELTSVNSLLEQEVGLCCAVQLWD